jgi:hypothetical protein
MKKRQGFRRHALTVLLGGSLVLACSFDPDLPERSSNAAPASSGVTLSGAGTRSDADAGVGYGDGARISDGNGKNGKNGAAAGGGFGGTDSGGAFVEGMKDIGGAASSASGAAGAGGASIEGEGEGGAAGASPQDPPQIWFSEYVEGSSSNKALEITARTRSVLDGCKISSYFNGKSEAAVVASLGGVLEAGEVLTLCTSTLKEKLAACNQVGNLTFNGDDVVTLSCHGELLDVIGQIGVDPGEAWGSDINTTADHTLRRSCATENGDPLGSDPFDPSSEWLPFAVDTFDGLGARGC